MVYTKTTFANGVAPAINATELNKIGDGIAEAHTLAAGASDSGVAALVADDGSDLTGALLARILEWLDDTGSALYAKVAAIIDSRVGLFIVQYTGTWGTYSTDPLQVRIFLSQPSETAPPPTYYNTRDLWFAYPSPAV